MPCSACGHANPEAARFCGGCGAPLAEALRCAACGEAHAAGQRFCHGCGAALGGAPTPAPRTYTPKHLAEKILATRSALEGERKQVRWSRACSRGLFVAPFVKVRPRETFDRLAGHALPACI